MLYHYYGNYYDQFSRFSRQKLDVEKAIDSFKKALKLKRRLNDNFEIARTLNKLSLMKFRLLSYKAPGKTFAEYCNTFEDRKIYQKAQLYLFESLEIHLKIYKDVKYLVIISILEKLAKSFSHSNFTSSRLELRLRVFIFFIHYSINRKNKDNIERIKYLDSNIGNFLKNINVNLTNDVLDKAILNINNKLICDDISIDYLNKLIQKARLITGDSSIYKKTNKKDDSIRNHFFFRDKEDQNSLMECDNDIFLEKNNIQVLNENFISLSSSN